MSQNMSSHTEYYAQNKDYAAFLSTWDTSFYAKYIDTLSANLSPRQRVLDVGCGVGQVIHELDRRGFAAHGVDVSLENIAKAQSHPQSKAVCQCYDGKKLPFPDNHFHAAGAFNVLEHVDEPEFFIRELVRVVQPQGRIVLSSPNFLRVLGFRDYHPRMRGLANKWKNWLRVCEIRRTIRQVPEKVHFEHTPPIIKDPFSPDDDAITMTNPFQMAFFLKRSGCRVEQILCTDRYVNPIVDKVLNATPLRFLMFNAFIVAKKLGE